MEYNLPENWAWATLEEIASKIHYGYTAKSTEKKIGPKLLRITDIQNNHVDWDAVPYCEIDAEESTKYLLKEGDLVVARTGATVGKSFLLKEPIPDSVFASYLIRIVITANVDKQYVYDFFRSQFYWDQIQKGVLGIAQPNVNAQTLSEIVIPLPPLAEQKRIVAKLEQFLGKVDACRERLAKIPQILKRFRQAVLAAACSGRLTEDWREKNPDVEPAEDLLKRLQSDDVIDLHTLPDSWRWAYLNKILQKIEAGKNFSCIERPPQSTEIGVAKISAVTWGEYDETETKTCNDINKLNEKILIKEGDFLFSRANTIELVGACVIVKKVNARIMLSDKVLRFHIAEIPREWLLYVLRSIHGRNEIESLATGNQMSMRNISQDKIRQIRIPLPPLAEQHEIVRRVEALFQLADRIEERYRTAKAAVDQITQTILAKAFRGELVPHEPSDEPASVLLEKIRKERESSKPGKKKRSRV